MRSASSFLDRLGLELVVKMVELSSAESSGSESGSWQNATFASPPVAAITETVREEMKMLIFGGVGFGGPVSSGGFSMIGYLSVRN